MKQSIVTACALVALALPAASLAASASASIGEGCTYRTGSFTVPPNKVASNITAGVDTGWLPCAGAGHATRAGVRLKGPAGNVIYYFVKTYEGQSQVVTGSLAGLTLGPGTYTVEAADGGLGTTATVGYELRDAAPTPPAAPAMTGPGTSGSLSGDWTDPAVRSSARIVQSGSSITITNTFPWEGKTVTWSGSGTVSGDTVTFAFDYTGYRPAGWEGGQMTLRRTDRKTLSGKWTTASGTFSQPITFIQTRFDDPEKPPQASVAPVPRQTAAPASSAPQQTPMTAKPRGMACPPGQMYEENVGCTPYLREKEER